MQPEYKSKVFCKTDERGVILAIDGGYTTPADLTGWTQIDEGNGDRFNLCQNNYLPSPVRDYRGLCRWKLVDGVPTERSQAEIDADVVKPVPQVTMEDLMLAMMELAQGQADLEDALIEIASMIGE